MIGGGDYGGFLHDQFDRLETFTALFVVTIASAEQERAVELLPAFWFLSVPVSASSVPASLKLLIDFVC